MSARPLLILLLLLSGIAGSPAAERGAHPHDDEILAVVAGEPITVRALRAYAMSHPLVGAYLAVPGKGHLVLEDMIAMRLFLKEGQRVGIPRDPGMEDELYYHRVRLRLVPPCPDPDAETLRAFYERHKDRYSTPTYLRLRRIGIRTGDDLAARDRARKRLLEIRRRIQSGTLDFAEAAERWTEDVLGKGRGGDVGFVPFEDPDDPFLEQLLALKPGAVSEPVVQGDYVFIYQVTARRDPIPTPYAELDPKALHDDYLKGCYDERFLAKLAALKKRWKVEYRYEGVPYWPEDWERLRKH